MNKPNKKVKYTNRERAQTMVEFALVFPIILLITYGIIEVGRAVFIYSAVTSAAREGARYGSAAGDVNSTTKYYMDCAGIRAAIRKTAILTQIKDNEIKVWYDKFPDTNKFPSSNICPSGVNRFAQDLPKLGNRIVVRLEVPYVPIIKFLNFGGFMIKAQNGRTILVRMPIPYP